MFFPAIASIVGAIHTDNVQLSVANFVIACNPVLTYLRSLNVATTSILLTVCDTFAANCSAGWYRDAATNACVACEKGSYQPEKWQTMCIPCQTEKTTADVGATSQDECAGKSNEDCICQSSLH